MSGELRRAETQKIKSEVYWVQKGGLIYMKGGCALTVHSCGMTVQCCAYTTADCALLRTVLKAQSTTETVHRVRNTAYYCEMLRVSTTVRSQLYY